MTSYQNQNASANSTNRQDMGTTSPSQGRKDLGSDQRERAVKSGGGTSGMNNEPASRSDQGRKFNEDR